MADLYELPANSDVAVLCTNLRELTGKRPVFADHIESDFLFPLLHLRFIEMPTGTLEAASGVRFDRSAAPRGEPAAGFAGTDEPDEAGAAVERPRLPAGEPIDSAGSPATPGSRSDDDLDEDFLRRVRDV